MPVRTKSIYDPPARDDGLRVLATQYWPRGVSRDRVGAYKRLLGPSRELLRDFRDGRIAWTEFGRRYRAEMKADEHRREIDALAAVAANKNVTIMCVCRSDEHCHRRLLKALVEQRMRRRS
jgi:uncharacterized protein YeaO (DUF488 family)